MIKIDGLTFKEMLAGGAKALELNRSTIDALNVFPVPDGDTGTNMSLTITSALREANACGSILIDEIAAAFSKGALRGARGNSGVISSQIFKGFAVALEGKAAITPKVFADCLKKGSQIAYSAVTAPKEGTILTVIRGMAEAAESFSRSRKIEFDEFLKKTIDAGEEILQRTPEMLPVLRHAGVVDAGGRGLITIIDGMYRALTGQDFVLLSGENVKVNLDDVSLANKEDPGVLENDYEHITYQYCTEFFITHVKREVTVAAIDRFRDYLTTIGDCVLVIGDTDLVKTHVHTNYPGRALNKALELGELDGVKIENMMEQYRRIHPEKAAVSDDYTKDSALISVCVGEGMKNIFKDLGADAVIEGGQTMNPSVDDILAAVNGMRAKTVYVLPNNSNIILAANQAKEIARCDVQVIPTENMPQGVAALLAYDPEVDAEENYSSMNSARRHIACIEVTKAVRNARMNGFSVKEGDIISLTENRILSRDRNIITSTLNAVRKLADGKDMLTVYYGEGVNETAADELVSHLGEAFPDLEVAAYYGGQPHYYYIISLE